MLCLSPDLCIYGLRSFALCRGSCSESERQQPGQAKLCTDVNEAQALRFSTAHTTLRPTLVRGSLSYTIVPISWLRTPPGCEFLSNSLLIGWNVRNEA